jgi:hypothetical protein
MVFSWQQKTFWANNRPYFTLHFLLPSGFPSDLLVAMVHLVLLKRFERGFWIHILASEV